jgi:hypothetical protein
MSGIIEFNSIQPEQIDSRTGSRKTLKEFAYLVVTFIYNIITIKS